jgi:hypothetical protein
MYYTITKYKMYKPTIKAINIDECLQEKIENINLVEHTNIDDMYHAYHYDCLRRNYKMLNIHDFTKHIKFINQKMYHLLSLVKFEQKQSSMISKLAHINYLLQNPSYEIELISNILIDIEKQIESSI